MTAAGARRGPTRLAAARRPGNDTKRANGPRLPIYLMEHWEQAGPAIVSAKNALTLCNVNSDSIGAQADMPRLTHDPVNGWEIHPDDDYPYDRDPCRNDPRRHLRNDTVSVAARQKEANDRGEPYFPTPWECWNIGKHWNVPTEAQEELIEASRPPNALREMIEPKLNDPSLFHGAPDEVATPWDGTMGQSANWGNIVTNIRIGVQWIGYHPGDLGKSSREIKNIGSCMRELGWTSERRRVDGMDTRPMIWIKPNWIRSANSENSDSVRNDSRTDDDDIPF